MKILRILRRRKIRLSYIFLLLVFFIVNTYAWISTDRSSEMGNISINVDSWSVAFIVEDEEIKTEEYTFDIKEFYPGISTPLEKTIDIYNIGESDTNLKYEITDIYLFGQKVLKKEVIDEQGQTILIPEIMTEEENDAQGRRTADLFGDGTASVFDENNENYDFYLRYPTPFTITYTYDKTYLTGKDQLGNDTASMTINLAWYNDENNNEEDTRLGKMVYDFENAKDENGNLINEGIPAIKIVTKITATKVDTGETYQ